MSSLVALLSFRIACVKKDVNENLVQEEVKAKVSYVQKARGRCALKRVIPLPSSRSCNMSESEQASATHLHRDHRPVTPTKPVTLHAHT